MNNLVICSVADDLYYMYILVLMTYKVKIVKVL